MRRQLLALVAAAALAPALVAGPAAAAGGARAGVGLRVADAPEGADARTRSYVVDTADAGDVLTRRLVAVNGTGAPARVRLYLASAAVRDGGFVVGAEDPSWGSVTPAEAVLPARASLPVTVRLVVPQDARSGVRYGGVVLEQAPAPARDAAGRPVLLTNRMAVRVHLTVTGAAAPAPPAPEPPAGPGPQAVVQLLPAADPVVGRVADPVADPQPSGLPRWAVLLAGVLLTVVGTVVLLRLRVLGRRRRREQTREVPLPAGLVVGDWPLRSA